jgi:uncharacterized SAM-binding protein YcdF (DUF218 family)
VRARSWGAWLAGLLSLLSLLLGAAWSLGFAAFLAAAHQVDALPAHADGIVVLTGGADRVAAGLHLLGEGRAPALLISGVGRGSGLGAIVRRIGLDARPLAAQVALGHAAQTTQGNAAETAAWVHQVGAHSLIVVTAGYHMPRALLEIGRALPGIALYPAPVQSPVLREVTGPAALRLLAGEFDKWLAARLGLRQVVPGLVLGGHGAMSAWPRLGTNRGT